MTRAQPGQCRVRACCEREEQEGSHEGTEFGCTEEWKAGHPELGRKDRLHHERQV